MKRGNCVYFISDGQFVKIGFTANVEKRLKQLQTGHRCKLSIVATIPGGTRNTESLLHAALRKHKLQGEWFKCQNEVLRVLVFAQHGKSLLTKEDITYATALPATTFNKHYGAKEKPGHVPTRPPDEVKIPKGQPAPVPEAFRGTPAEDRINALNIMRADKTLTSRELGRVYMELRHLINGRVLTRA